MLEKTGDLLMANQSQVDADAAVSIQCMTAAVLPVVVPVAAAVAKLSLAVRVGVADHAQ